MRRLYAWWQRAPLIAAASVAFLTACSGAVANEDVQGVQEDISDADATVTDGLLGDPLSDAQVDEITAQLSLLAAPPDVLLEIEQSGDLRFMAPLLEIMRFLPREDGVRVGAVMDSLTGQGFGANWFEWMGWAARNELPLTSGYAAWKSEQLTILDSSFTDFIYDGVPTTIRLDEVVWGGVAVDGIPALDNARQIAPDEAGYLTPDELVFGIEINGDERAYPLRIMDWHEMFNDVVGGKPVSLAYCTLCGAGILYDTSFDGEIYTFGSTGLLMRSNKLMYDRNTRSVWNQLTGEPVMGELVGSGIKLEILPVTVTTWQDWLSDHPATTVLDIDTGFPRDYSIGAAYANYFASPDTMFPVGIASEERETKELVFTLIVDETPKAYPLAILSEERVTNDILAGLDIVLVTGVAPELTSPEPGGAAVRAYERGEHTFSPAPDGDDDKVVDESGAVWTVTEEALTAPDGTALARVPGHLAFWFGWYAFYQDTLLYEG